MCTLMSTGADDPTACAYPRACSTCMQLQTPTFPCIITFLAFTVKEVLEITIDLLNIT